MEKNKNCWDLFDCNEETCPVYKSKDPRCWLISGNHCRNEIQGRCVEKIEMCINCAALKANMDLDSAKETLKVLHRQFTEFRKMGDLRDRQLESTSMELAMGLSEVFEALKRIAAGDPAVRVSKDSKLELIAKLKHMVNLTAQNLGEIVDMSHEFAIGLAEHFDVLHRVSSGDLTARVSGISEVELLESLREVTNQMIGSVSREITERKQAVEALRQSQQRLKIAGKVAYDLIYEWDAQDDSLEWFGDIDDILGYDANKIPKTIKGWIGLIHPDDVSGLEDAVELHRTSTEAISYEYRIRHHNGSWRYWSDRALPVLDAAGRPCRWIGVCTDITERKKVEEALRKSEERMRAVFEASPDPVVVYDTQGHPEYLNPAFTRVFGWSLDELGGKTIPFVPDNQEEMTALKIKEIYESGEPVTFETQRLTKGGASLDVLASAALIWESTGRPSGMVVNLTDITGTKECQAHLQRAQKMEAIGTLAGGIAHDFNNVLSIIVGNTELAMDDIPEQNPAQKSLEEVKKACLRARDMVKQILGFSRHTEQEQRPVNMGRVLKDTVQLLRSSIPRTIDIRSNIPAESHTVLADATQITQVLINLCSNSAHAMAENGGILEVTVENTKLDEDGVSGHQELMPGDYVRLTVSDTGYGIKPQFLDRIFDPYFTTKGVGEGSGLGLAVVHGIVRTHGGAVTVDSEAGKGSTFSVWLPSIDSEVTGERSGLEPLPRGNERILFVDDENALAKVGEQMLENLGYRVVSRTSSLEALNVFCKQPDKFDLVITDMTMPSMTGDHFAKEVLKVRPDIPVILCTGYSERMNERQATAMGVRAFVIKPMVKREMAETVRRVLDDD